MRHLNIACYAYNFEGYNALYDLLEQIGLAGTELSMFSDQPSYMERLAAQAGRFSRFYVTFHGPYLELEVSSPFESEEHGKVIRVFGQALEIYRAFSAGSIVMHTNQRVFTPEEKRPLQNNVVATLTELAAMADRARANLLVENVGEYLQGTMLFEEEEFIGLFDRLPPSVHGLLDIGHASLNGWDLERVIRTLGPRIRAYHLHNNDGTGDIHRPLFEEGMKMKREDLQALFGWMERYTPQSDWILEYAPGGHITRQLMVQEVREVLSLLKAIACN
jgi:sugar phosphate isomerase/epimerase